MKMKLSGIVFGDQREEPSFDLANLPLCAFYEGYEAFIVRPSIVKIRAKVFNRASCGVSRVILASAEARCQVQHKLLHNRESDSEVGDDLVVGHDYVSFYDCFLAFAAAQSAAGASS